MKKFEYILKLFFKDKYLNGIRLYIIPILGLTFFPFSVHAIYTTNSVFELQNGSSTKILTVLNNGNVGIGKTNPIRTLDMVAGGIYGYNGTVLLQASTTKYNYFISGGNLTMTGRYNLGIGPNSLKSNTTGSGNTAFGSGSLYSNTQGEYNTAIGTDSLRSNTNGSSNVAIGESALYSNLSTSNNIMIGSLSGFYNENGYDNVGIGYGVFANTDLGYGNTGIGTLVGVSDSSISYSTGIGYGVQITQSNTMVLGADSGTGVVDVGIGTSTPTEKLVVQGNVLADSYLEYSPIYIGDALLEIKKIKPLINEKRGEWLDVDHETLPQGVKYTKWITNPAVYATSSKIIINEETQATSTKIYTDYKKLITATSTWLFTGRDMGKQVQVNVRAIQQLIEEIDILKGRITELENKR